MTFTIRKSFDQDGHLYRTYDWESVEGWQDRLANKLVPLIRELYSDFENLNKSCQETGLEGTQLEQFLETALKATIPKPREPESKTPKQFDVCRADLAELLALVCLDGLFATKVPVKNIYSRELNAATSRGLDILGYEKVGNDLSLIICEVKGSEDGNSPPSVVETGEDSLKQQLYSYVTRKEKTLDRILNISKRAPSIEDKKILAQIAMNWAQGAASSLKVIVCPFLVRKMDCYKDTDYGSFRTAPGYHAPAKIRFLIVCVNSDLNALAEHIYSKARSFGDK
ncbi:MAG: hypothetical protein WC133_06385 [Candidatus Omnitrophota bacterium]